jgi:TldD protein
LGEERSPALLAVWDHPRLGEWLGELSQPPPQRCWTPPAGMRLPILFAAGTAGVLLHEILGHMVEADLATTGGSPLSKLRGAVITPPTVSLVDDPTRFDLPGAFSCDDEGVAAEPITLVEDGVLVNWLCDRAGADRLGAPEGRGRRATWWHPPAPRLSNLVVSPGDTPADAIEADLDHGLVVTRIGGATVDPISTRSVVMVERGWEISHGRRRRPLAPCALTGSVLEILAHLDPHLGAELEPDWRLGWCVKGGLPLATGSLAPALLAHRLEVL